MKSKILALVLMIAVMILSSCLIFGGVADEGDVTVVVETADGYEVYKTYLESVENKNEGAKGILEHLDEVKDEFNIEMDDTGYGAFVTAVGDIRQDASAGAYIMVYTSVKTDSYEGAPTVEYEGTTLYQSGVGISGMTINPDTVILLRLEVYEF